MATAQVGAPFDLFWNTVDSGGGPSDGETFSCNGTIGQPDASAPVSGGGFTLTGGFWAFQADSGLPRLTIGWASANTLILSWPNPSTGFQLQETSALGSGVAGWANVTAASTVVGPNKQVTLPIGPGSRGFRLCRP